MSSSASWRQNSAPAAQATQCLAEQQVQQSTGHAAIIMADGLPDELAAQHPRSTFSTHRLEALPVSLW
jgi:hypothetical protein